MKFEYNIIEKSSNQLKVHLPLNEDMDCFDGHFDQIAIMPAVAQLYIVEQISKKHFKQLAGFERMNQVKFVAPIFPDSIVVINIRIDFEKQLVFFEYKDKDKEQLKSKGNIYYSRKQASNE